MRPAPRLLARLLPLAATAVACSSSSSKAPVEPLPTVATPTAAASTGRPPPATAVPAAPSTPATIGTATATAAATTSAKPLKLCNQCTTHCFNEPAGECPNALGPELDQKLGCRVETLEGRQRNGAQCCYGFFCPGRPLLRGHDDAPRLAELVVVAWA